MRRTFLLLVLLGGAWSLPVPATACNVPVFRYALEHWNKRQADDLYSLYVFHQGPFPDALRKDLDDLDARLEEPNRLANLLVYRVDSSRELADPTIAKLYEQEKKVGAKVPWMVLRFPDTWGLERSLHVGPYDRDVIEKWLDSPLRKSIGRHLLQGHSAVFLLLESKDKVKNEVALERVRKSLNDAEKELTLPNLTDSPKDKILREDIPLKISFGLITLSRTDVAEKHLIDMFIAMDHDNLLERDGEPVLIPIYGRGIAMVDRSLIGKGITGDNVMTLVRFLLGPCSCEIRRLNPGIEILSAFNWDGPAPAETTTAAGIPVGNSSSEESSPSGKGNEVRSFAAAESGDFGMWRNFIWVFGGVLAVVIVGSMVVVGRRNSLR